MDPPINTVDPPSPSSGILLSALALGTDLPPLNLVDSGIEDGDGPLLPPVSLSLATDRRSAQKRRRSSAHSVAGPPSKLPDIPKPKKAHKKKLRKANSALLLTFSKRADLSQSFNRVRELILCAFYPATSKPRDLIAVVNNRNKVRLVVLCFAPGLPSTILDQFTTSHPAPLGNINHFRSSSNDPDGPLKESCRFFPHIYQNFDECFVSSSPGSKDTLFPALHGLTHLQHTKKERKELIEALKAHKITIDDLLMTTDQLNHNGYPNLDTDTGPEWARTVAFEHSGSTIFAMDCEFCVAASGHVLTRISLVDFEGKVVFDSLVKPEQEILDYATKYSGITPEMLEEVTTTLEQVQERLVLTVSSTDILIGHSLESDLKVLKLKHDRVVDTLIIYEHNRGPPSKPSLRWLTETYLNRRIQQGEATGSGHSPIEDAQACLELVKLKIQEGLIFGTAFSDTSLYKRLKDTHNKQLLFVSHAEPSPEGHLDSEGVFRVGASDDDEVVKQYILHGTSKDFLVLNFKELEYNLEWHKPPASYKGLMPPKTEDGEAQEMSTEHTVKPLEELYQRLDSRLNEVYMNMPEDSIMFVYSPTNDPREVYRLQKVRRRFQNLVREGVDLSTISSEDQWEFGNQTALLNACLAARKSLTLVAVKASTPCESSVEDKDDLQND